MHLCLYFISGHRLQLNDVIYLKKLQKYVNILPVLSSTDEDIDSDEVEAYKHAIAREAKDYGLEWTDLNEELGGKMGDILEELELEPLMPIPPFWF